MKCPRCQSSNFEPFHHQTIEFDFCTDCRGIWCDHGELADYVETLKDLPQQKNISGGSDLTDLEVKSDLNCPKCLQEKLYERSYIQGQPTRIDYCKACHGLWLDFKELAFIQKYARHIDTEGKLERAIDKLKKMGYSL
jgi:Zn-finger nucleic acid-binding protein